MSLAIQMKVRKLEQQIIALETRSELIEKLALALAGDRKGPVGEARLALVPDEEEEREAS